MRRAAIVLLLVASVHAAAQEATPPAGDSLHQRLAREIDASRRVRVYTATDMVELREPRWTPAGIAYGTLVPPRMADRFANPVPLVDVAAIRVRRNHAVIGTVVGAAALGAFGFAFGQVIRYADGSADVDPRISGTLAGLLVGGFLGNWIGTALPNWKLVYARGDTLPPQASP